MAEAAEAEVALAGADRVSVEQGLGQAALARLAAHDRMLAAFAVADEIGVGAVRARDRRFVLLDAAFHFRKQLLLQRYRVGERGRRIVVLGFEIAADRRVELRLLRAHSLSG